MTLGLLLDTKSMKALSMTASCYGIYSQNTFFSLYGNALMPSIIAVGNYSLILDHIGEILGMENQCSDVHPAQRLNYWANQELPLVT
jgi:hypothetical protein